MKQLLIAKDVAYAAKTGGGTVTKDELDVLADGAVAILTEAGALVPAAPANTLDDVKSFQIAVGTPAGQSTIITDLIKRANADVHQQAYAAAVAQVTYIGSDTVDGDFNWTLANVKKGDYAAIHIIPDTDYRTAGAQMERLSYDAVSDNPSLATVVTGLVNAINAGSNIVTAASVDTNQGISLTSKVPGVGFKVVCISDSFLADADVQYNVAPYVGVGTPALVTEMEKEADVYRGRMYGTKDAEFPQLSSVVDSGATYDIFTINAKDSTLGLQTNDFSTFIQLAVPEGTPTAGNTHPVLVAIFAVAFGLTGADGIEVGA